MTMFITGGTSSIGRVLVQELARQGKPMRLLVRPNSNREGLELPGVTFVHGDVTDALSVQQGMAGCDQVTHLAAVVGQKVAESEWWRINRDGTQTVLRLAHEQQVKSMVQVSSVSVLGSTAPGETADESRPINTGLYVNLYQKTKHAADEIARNFAGKGLPVKIVYPAFGFGCSQASSHPSLQDQTLLRMAAGKPVAMMGRGQNKLTLAYYNDTVQGILLAHERGQAGEGYILGNEVLTFAELWGIIAAVLDHQPPKVRIPTSLLKLVSAISNKLTGEPFFPDQILEMLSFHWSFSNQKAKTHLGWQPLTVREGMSQTWADYRAKGWHAKG